MQSFDSDVMLTHLALCVGGGVLFAGTESGAVRAYQYPLIGMLLVLFFCSLNSLSSDHTSPVQGFKNLFDATL